MTATIERFETIDNDLLERLAAVRSSLCVSIFMPTHRNGDAIQQDPIRLKNAVKTAKKQLLEFGTPEAEVDSMLQPVIDLAAADASSDFWQHQSNGLAVLLSGDESLMFQLPVTFAEEVAVSDRFLLKPLIRAQTSNHQFHVVTVSRNAVRVFRGNASGLTEEYFDELPEGIEEVASGNQHRGHNRHSFRIRSNSSDSSVPHGHVQSDDEADLKQYFREIRGVIGDHLKTHDGAVVFAGVDELFPYFKAAFDGFPVIDQAACGNSDHLAADQIHDRVRPLVETWADAHTTQCIERFREAEGTDFGSVCLKTILTAAHQGGIDTLLLHSSARNYGTCDENGVMERNDEEASAETYDLFDIAAVRTLRADGKVLFVDETSNVESPIAAILRFVP